MNVLIVDDEPLAIARLTRLLTSLGHTFITAASNAPEAILLAHDQKFDVAFLDISMAGMDGIELGYALRYDHEDLAIIYQTAYDHHALKAFDVGAVDYLLKPYTVENLERAGESESDDVAALVKADLSEVMFRSQEGFSYYPKKISDVEALLEPHGFLRIHRSYLINLNRVKEMETIDQSRISFGFEGIKETIESSKDGAKHFRHLFKSNN